MESWLNSLPKAVEVDAHTELTASIVSVYSLVAIVVVPTVIVIIIDRFVSLECSMAQIDCI